MTAPALQVSQPVMPELPTHLQQKLSAQLMAFKTRKIYNNPVVACYRK